MSDYPPRHPRTGSIAWPLVLLRFLVLDVWLLLAMAAIVYIAIHLLPF